MAVVAPTAGGSLVCKSSEVLSECLPARRLVARVYVDAGYIGLSDVDDDGLIREELDPYYQHSTYFAVGTDGPFRDPIAVSRQVRYNADLGRRSFPMLHGVELDQSFEDTVADADLRTWLEVGSLAKQTSISAQAPNLLYRAMWQHSVRAGHATWLFAADRKVSRTLQNLFGSEVTRVGPRQVFMGSASDPLVMHPPTSADWLAAQAASSRNDDSTEAQLVRLALGFFLDGLEAEHFSDAQLERFSAGGVDLRKGAIIDLTGKEPLVNLT